MQNKPAKIVWYLKNFEVWEFATTCKEDDFLNPEESPPFFDEGEHLVPLYTICGPQPMFTDMEMPTSLQAHVATAPPKTTPMPTGNGGTDPMNTGTGKDPNNNNRDQHKHTNTNFHPLLKEFWEKCPENKRKDPLSKWFKASSTMAMEQMKKLGLKDSHCGHTTFRG